MSDDSPLLADGGLLAAVESLSNVQEATRENHLMSEPADTHPASGAGR